MYDNTILYYTNGHHHNRLCFVLCRVEWYVLLKYDLYVALLVTVMYRDRMLCRKTLV